MKQDDMCYLRAGDGAAVWRGPLPACGCRGSEVGAEEVDPLLRGRELHHLHRLACRVQPAPGGGQRRQQAG